MELPVNIDKEQITQFCRKHHIVRLSLFGSVLTERFSEESDVDVLVEFDAAHIPGMIRLCGMERELSAVFGRKTDMRIPNDLSRHFPDEVLRTAVAQYAA